MNIRLGDLLVEHGCLTPDQRDEIVRVQQSTGRPFGTLAERLFGVSPADVEHAWATQYAAIAPRFDPRLSSVDPDILSVIERRQAWQFRLIPVRQEGDEIVFVTTVDDLARALRFAGWRVPGPCTFCICDRDTLATALNIHYPIEGMDKNFLSGLLDDLEAA